MPWSTRAEAREHVAGLSDHQADVWLAAANAALSRCLEDGGSQEECEGRAVRIANAAAQDAPKGALRGGLEHKTVAIDQLKLLEASERAAHGGFTGYASVFHRIDLVGDTVLPGAYEKTLPTFVRDGFIAWGHDWDNPIATVDDAREDEHGLLVSATFHSTEAAQRARAVVAERLERGKSMGLSIGYAAKDWKLRSDGVRELLTVDLMETSLVTVPAEPNAQVTAIKRLPEVPEQAQPKGAIASHTTPKADEGAGWDAGQEVASASGAAQLRRMHAWIDPDGDPEAKSSYKLPHHRASGEVVWRGVAAAMAALKGGRGGVDIPSEDEGGVWQHLAGHYRQFDKEPPAKGAPRTGVEGKEGRVLSGRNVERLKSHMATLRTVLEDLENLLADAAPPDKPDDGGAAPGAEKGARPGVSALVPTGDAIRAFAEYQRTLLRRNGARV